MARGPVQISTVQEDSASLVREAQSLGLSYDCCLRWGVRLWEKSQLKGFWSPSNTSPSRDGAVTGFLPVCHPSPAQCVLPPRTLLIALMCVPLTFSVLTCAPYSKRFMNVAAPSVTSTLLLSCTPSLLFYPPTLAVMGLTLAIRGSLQRDIVVS